MQSVSRRSAIATGISAAAMITLPGGAGKTAQSLTDLRALVGATVSTSTFGSKNWLDAIAKWDGDVGVPMAARCERFYYEEGDWTPVSGASSINIAGQNHIAVVPSFKPSRSLKQTEITKLTGAMQEYITAGVHVPYACLWHEPNDPIKKPFASAADYIAYVRYYGPALAAMVPLTYIPLILTSDGVGQAAFYPGNTYKGKTLISAIMPDFYCATQYTKGVRIDHIESFARLNKRPFGLGEIGMTDSPTAEPHPKQYVEYVGYIQSIMSGRLRAGLKNAPVMEFAGSPRGVPNSSGFAALNSLIHAIGYGF
jgi:hypothetical protein